jgi:hypothetical protein
MHVDQAHASDMHDSNDIPPRRAQTARAFAPARNERGRREVAADSLGAGTCTQEQGLAGALDILLSPPGK